MIPVELTSDVVASQRRLRDRGERPRRGGDGGVLATGRDDSALITEG